MKKIISFLLIISVLLALCSCRKDEQLETTTAANGSSSVSSGADTLKLAYITYDSLNPYEATSTVNIRLMALLYDGLFSLNKSYEPAPCIAKSCAVGKTVLNISLRSGVVFSDGTPVTAQDVVYSFDLAKESAAYSASLSNFTRADASTASLVAINLASPDPYATACLTFPIVKNGCKGDFPTGSGRYIAQETEDSTYLIVNTKHSGFNPIIKTIRLVGLKEESALSSSLEIGNTCFYYDELADGKFSRINAKTVESGMNNLVYLGFNSASPVFSNAALRRAANLALNRKKIADTAFQGHARIAYTPFNPDWYPLANKDLVVAQDLPEAQALVAKASSDTPLKTVSLLVNADNPFKLEAATFIADQLAAVGFSVTVKSLALEAYKSAVSALQYDIYIGEVRLNKNMDLSPLLPGGSVGYGISRSSACSARYNQLLDGSCEIMDFINTFNDDLPFLPLCYRNAAASYTNSLAGSYAGCDSDVFCDIDTWYFK